VRLEWLVVFSVVCALACGETFDTGASGNGGAASASRSASQASNGATTSSAQGGSSCGPGSVAEVSDGFEAGPFDPQWQLWNDEGASVAQDNELVLSIALGTMTRYAGVSSTSTYSLASCAVTVKLAHPPTSAGTIAFLKLNDGGRSNYLWTYVSIGIPNRLVFGYRKDGIEAQEVETMLDASEQRYWRIAEKNGEIVWQTAPDGEAWVTARQEPSPFPIDQVRINLGAGSETTIATATEARFDDLNL
jgi:hypothetical protein